MNASVNNTSFISCSVTSNGAFGFNDISEGNSFANNYAANNINYYSLSLIRSFIAVTAVSVDLSYWYNVSP